MNKRMIHSKEQNVKTAGTDICQGDAQHMARGVHYLMKCTILRKYVDARTDRLLEMTVDKELLMKHAKTMKRQT